MKKKLIPGCIFFSVFLLFSCNSQGDIPTSTSYPNYMPLAVGNYWIYEDYDVDSLGNERQTKIVDSVYIPKDTVLNNKKYFIVETSGKGGFIQRFPRFLRDSSGYLVSNVGKIIFSATNFKDTISKEAHWKSGQFVDSCILVTLNNIMKPEVKTVTIGTNTYKAITVEGNLTAYYYDEKDLFINTKKIIQNAYYTANIGKIIDQYYYYSNIKLKKRGELRLVRYHIN